MTFVPYPWQNKRESATTPLDRQNLNAAEEALAAQMAPEEPESLTITQPSASGPVALNVNSASSKVKGHTASINCSAESGTNTAAINITSQNPEFSASEISGCETGHGTLKISHTNKTGSATGDENAAMISLELHGTEPNGWATKVQGIYMKPATDAGNEVTATGNWITVHDVKNAKLFAVRAQGAVETAEQETTVSPAPESKKALWIVKEGVPYVVLHGGAVPLITGSPSPVQQNLLGWSFDPVAAVNSTILAESGRVYFARIPIASPVAITKAIIEVGTKGSGLKAGENWIGVYSADGSSKLGVSGDMTTAFGEENKVVEATLTPTSGGSLEVNPGSVIVAIVANGTTRPTIIRGSGAALINTGVSGTASRFGKAQSGVTTVMPSSLSSMTTESIAYWAAVA